MSDSNCIKGPHEIIVTITSSNLCNSCVNILYDEEILTQYMKRSQSKDDIKCPHCATAIQPKLFIKIYCHLIKRRTSKGLDDKDSPTDEDNDNDNEPCIRELARLNVSYLNPLFFRRISERKLSRTEHGLWFPSMDAFNGRQDFLWNVVWWFYRIGCPTHLLDRLQDWLIVWQRRCNGVPNDIQFSNIRFYKANATIDYRRKLPIRILGRWNDIGPRRQSSKFLYLRYEELLNNQKKSISDQIQSNCIFSICLFNLARAINERDYEGMLQHLLHLRRASQENINLDSYSSCDHEKKCIVWKENSSLYREIIFMITYLEGYKTEFAKHDVELREAIEKLKLNLNNNYDRPITQEASILRDLFRPLLLENHSIV